jgi:cell division protein FtsQ
LIPWLNQLKIYYQKPERAGLNSVGMDTKQTIRKIVFTVIALVAGAGMLTLLIAAIGEKKKGECVDYKITVKSANDNLLIDDRDVFKLLSTATGGAIKGQAVSAINTRKLEDMLENNVWISDAQLYFDNRNVLHVAVKEREPLARLFTTAGNSFYIDSNEKRMPLSDKTTARVLVFTGFPDKKVLSQKDSALLNHVKRVAQFIRNDSFWALQASAFDITPEQNFEMVPVIGNHFVRIGDAENLEQKFHRLFLFYNTVLSKTGFDKYKVIDAQYDGQIVALRKGEKSGSVDTAKLKLNVQKLIKQSLEVQTDTMVTAKNVVVKNTILNASDHVLIHEKEESDPEISSPNPLKLSVKANPEKKPIEKPSPVQKKTAKAVMPKKGAE